MNRFLLTGVVLATAAISTVPADAAANSNKEIAGAAAGVVIGAAAGGPPGAIIGAGIGAMFGDRSHRKDLKLAELDATVDARETTIARLERDVATLRSTGSELRGELAALDASGARELHELLVRGLEIELPYRTDATELPDEMQARLSAIAALLSSTPGLSVQVDGYADTRGSVDYNQALSLARAEHVRELLTEAGVAGERVQTFGHGEPMTGDEATATHPDQLALQRRVTVTFYRDNTAEEVAALDIDR